MPQCRSNALAKGQFLMQLTATLRGFCSSVLTLSAALMHVWSWRDCAVLIDSASGVFRNLIVMRKIPFGTVL